MLQFASMAELKWSDGLVIDAYHLSFQHIYQLFAQSQYGRKLEDNIRFAPYKPATISHQRWQQILGDDVNNLYHLKVSFVLTQQFLQEMDNPFFTMDEQQVLLFTALVHDWAEAVIGDIPFHLKTGADEAREMIELKHIMQEVLVEQIEQTLCDELCVSVKEILMQRQTKLGMAFNAIEVWGYMRTGLRAWHASENFSGDLAENLKLLAFDVVTGHSPKLRQYALTYAPLHTFIKQQEKVLTSIQGNNNE